MRDQSDDMPVLRNLSYRMTILKSSARKFFGQNFGRNFHILTGRILPEMFWVVFLVVFTRFLMYSPVLLSFIPDFAGFRFFFSPFFTVFSRFLPFFVSGGAVF